MQAQMGFCVQAAGQSLTLQMQQLQQQVSDSIAAAAAMRHEKEAALEQLRKVIQFS